MFPGLDLHYADPAHHLRMADQDLDGGLSDLSDPSVRRVDYLRW